MCIYKVCIHVYKLCIRTYKKFIYIYVKKIGKKKPERKTAKKENKKTKTGKKPNGKNRKKTNQRHVTPPPSRRSALPLPHRATCPVARGEGGAQLGAN